MVNICVEIETTRDIARQILRHRSFSFQEFSQRYAKVEDFVTSDVRLQDIQNRQNSIENVDRNLEYWWDYTQNSLIDHVELIYKNALERPEIT